MIAAVATLMLATVVQPCGDSQRAFTGQVENQEYGYSVTLPAGIVGCNSPPPRRQHGFEVVFRQPQGGRIEVDGRDNPDYRDLQEAVDQRRVWTQKRAVGKVAFVVEPTTLGTLAATRIRAEFVARVGKRPLVEETVLALRAESNVLYVISYSSPSTDADQVRNAFDSILSTWQAKAVRPKADPPLKPKTER